MPWGFARGTTVLAEAAGCPQHPGLQPWREEPVEARWSLPTAPARHHRPVMVRLQGLWGWSKPPALLEGSL